MAARLSVVALDFLHGAQAFKHILVALLVEDPLKRRVVGEQEVDGLRFVQGFEPRHGVCPLLRSEQRLERLGDHTGILADVQGSEMHPKHPDLEDELADLVEVQAIELGLHALFQTAQPMEQHVLLERQIARIEDGLLNHALQHVEFTFKPLECDQAAKLAELLFVAAQQGELQLAGHTQRGVCPHIGVAVSVSTRPKPNAQHAVVEPLPIRTSQGIRHAGAQGAARLKKHILEVPNLPDRLLVRGGRLALEKRGQSQLVQALSDVDQVVVRHGDGQIRDDGQHISGIELRRVGRQHHTHGILREHGAHLVLESMAPHALHQALERLRPAQVVQLGVPRIFEGVDQHNLALDVLDDPEQQGRSFLRVGLALAVQKVGQDVVGCRALLQAQFARFLQQGHPKACLAYAIQRQGQENAVEHLIGVADHRPIILLLAHDGCKVTSYF